MLLSLAFLVALLGTAQVALGQGAKLPIHLHARQEFAVVNATESSAISLVTMSTDKLSYYTIISLGEIFFRVALDSASSDLWILSSDCTTAACKPVPRYPLAYDSPTFTSVNSNNTLFNASYADGTALSGFVARESVHLSNITVPNQAFGLITSSNVTLDDEISGVLGLGFPRLSTISGLVANATPFFANLAQQGLLDYPLFGLSLSSNATGTLSIGAIDSSVVQNISQIEWNEVVPFSPFGIESNQSSYLQWAIPLSSFGVNGTQVTPLPTYPLATANMSIALLDIGANGVYGPYQDVSQLFSLIEGSRLVDPDGQWAIPCGTAELMSFTFGDQIYEMQPSDYLIAPTLGDPNLCLTWPRALPPSSDGIDWQFGLAFMQTIYTIFSYGINTKESPMIGFYQFRANSTTAESPAAVSSFLSMASQTIATTLPNFPVATPTYTTPPYAFNTSVYASIGEIVSSELATSTYSPVLGDMTFNVTGLPTISPAPTLVTFILTDPSGIVTTSTSTLTQPSITLGLPPGWTNASPALRVSTLLIIFPVFLSLFLSRDLCL